MSVQLLAYEEAHSMWIKARKNAEDANNALEIAEKVLAAARAALEDSGPKPYTRDWFIDEAAAANKLYESLPSFVKSNMVFAGAFLNSKPDKKIP
jgi:hypothetical protein